MVIRLTSCKLDLFYANTSARSIPCQGCDKVRVEVARAQASLCIIYSRTGIGEPRIFITAHVRNTPDCHVLETIEREIVEG